jgi:regulatory protein
MGQPMSVDDGSESRGTGSRRRSTCAERRERRAAVDDVGEVLDAAARFLEPRPRSVAEVRRRLTSAGYRSELIDAAIERLLALQYLDDDAFARAWVESRDRAHPRGEHALRRELQLKGVERSVIEAVLDERRTSADDSAADGGERIDPEFVAAERLLERNLRTLARVTDPRKRRQRAFALLARSGFAPDVCSSVATAWLAEADGDATP